MKYILLSIVALFLLNNASAQKHTPLPHGMIFGGNPSTVGLMPASKLEDFMGKRTRTSAAISGVILSVIKPQGGWFILDAGKGRTIAAHFKNYNVLLPAAIKGREVIISGVVTKQFTADDQQQLAGSREHAVKTNPKQRLAFEVVGLMVNR